MVGYAENAEGSRWPLTGLLLGNVVAALLTVLLYFGAIRINFAVFFKYTGRSRISLGRSRALGNSGLRHGSDACPRERLRQPLARRRGSIQSVQPPFWMGK